MHKNHRHFGRLLKLGSSTWHVAYIVLIGTVAGFLILLLALAGTLFRWVMNQIDSLSTTTHHPINPA